MDRGWLERRTGGEKRPRERSRLHLGALWAKGEFDVGCFGHNGKLLEKALMKNLVVVVVLR